MRFPKLKPAFPPMGLSRYKRMMTVSNAATLAEGYSKDLAWSRMVENSVAMLSHLSVAADG